MDVVDTRSHFGETRRVAAPFLGRPRHHGVEPAHTLRPALVHPLVDALVVDHDDRGLGLVFGRHVAQEHVRRLDDVVIDAHQDQIVDIHEAQRLCSLVVSSNRGMGAGSNSNASDMCNWPALAIMLSKMACRSSPSSS